MDHRFLQRFWVGMAIVVIGGAALTQRVVAHCKPPPVRVILPTGYAVPPNASWYYWWEANRDPYLVQIRQDHRFQGMEEDFVARLREEAVAVLMEAMEHDRPQVRAEAALALGRMGEAPAAERIRELAGDDRSEEVRRHALLAIGLIGGEDAEDFLRELTYPTEALEETGLLTLGLLDELSGATRRNLREHVQQAEPSVSYASSWSLKQHARPGDADFFIGQVRQERSPWLVSDAILALGHVATPEAKGLLADIAVDHHRARNLATRRMLEQMAREKRGLFDITVRPPEDADPGAVVRGVQLDPRRRQRYLEIHDGLRDLHPQPPERRSLGPLNDARLVLGVEETHVSRLRLSAVMALGQAGDAEASVPLIELLDQREDAMTALPQRFALIALGKLAEPRGGERILDELDIVTPRGTRRPIDSTAGRRGYAAIAAGLYARPAVDEDGQRADREGTIEAIELLAERLLDPREVEEVRTAAALALGLTRRTEVLPALQRVSETLDERSDDLLIGYVMLARGMLGDRNILEPAAGYLDLRNNRADGEGVMARRAAALGVGMLGLTEGIPILNEAWDLSYDVSREAIRALGMCNAGSVVEVMVGHYRDPDNYIEQVYVCRVLGELFEAERPSRLASFSNGSNFLIDNVRMLPFRVQANEFLYHYMIPGLGPGQDLTLDWGDDEDV